MANERERYPNEHWGIICLLRWLRIRADNGKPFPESLGQLEVDIDHSALLRRLLSGKEPLPQPPPLKHSYPDYGEK